jgi:aminopeptidase-like protein
MNVDLSISDLKKKTSAKDIGMKLHQVIAELYPICRSITGDGYRETLKKIQKYIPLTIHEVPSGTKVFDWTVPKEWNIRDAYVKDSRGRKVIDFKQSNLHVVSYSVPVKKKMRLSKLKDHLISLPEHPEWIPYRTSYYKEHWGFCLSHHKLLELEEGEYEVFIDSSLEEGTLTYGEYYLRGKSEQEILVSCHACHPSLCNDNLSGVVVAAFVAEHLSSLSLQYSYRFLFIPGTIGSITWLSLNESNISRIKNGLTLACVGDSGRITYKKSRRGDAEVDRAAREVLKHSGEDYEILEFSPYGYDERQFCSPGFNLPVGCFMRTPFSRFPEYHTSADNLEFVKSKSLADSFTKTMSIMFILENNRTYLSLNPKCEPQLGKRGLYRMMGGSADENVNELALLWVLNQSDGQHSLLDIAEKSSIEFSVIKKAAEALQNYELLTLHSENESS